MLTAYRRKDRTYCTFPARPTWRISPVRRSSALRTGQELTSALASVTSSLVPKILYVVFSGSMPPNSGTSVLYLFGGESVVGKSS